MTPPALTIVRRFAATAERVFDAWLDPERAALWLFTAPGREAHSMQNDPRVGGHWVITDRRDGVEYKALGEYVEIDRPRRLVFTFGMPQFSPDFNRVTVEIAPDGEGCLMSVTQEGVPSDDHPDTREGWEEMFVMLDAVAA